MMKSFSYIRSFHASRRSNLMTDGTVRNIFLGCLIECAGQRILFFIFFFFDYLTIIYRTFANLAGSSEQESFEFASVYRT